jgi:hypothetical protein
MEILLTVRGGEPGASPGKQRLDVLPHPRGPITDHTKPYLSLWNQPRLFNLLEGLTKLFLVLHLVSAQEMDYALVIDQIRRFLKKNIPHHNAEAGRIRISHLGNSGWRSKRLSIACMAFLLSAIPF